MRLVSCQQLPIKIHRLIRGYPYVHNPGAQWGNYTSYKALFAK